MKRHLLLVLAALALLLAACGGGAAPAASNTQLPAAATATQEPPTAEPPTNTPEPDLTATAQSNVDAFVKEHVAADLELVGFSIDAGELGFIQKEAVEIVGDQPGVVLYNQPLADPNPIFKNFVMGLDVKWDSETGLAGCDVVFRADEDFKRGEIAVFSTARIVGNPGWDFETWNFGEFQTYLSGGFHRNSVINDEPGSSNHYILIALGPEVTVWGNGERMGSGTLKVAMSEGVIGLEAWQESGFTTCTFTNVWVWELP